MNNDIVGVMNRVRRLWIGVGLVAALGLLAGCGSAPMRTSAQSDYPVLPEPDFVTTVPTTLAQQATDATLIIDATVAKVLPNETVKVNLDPNSPEGKINQKTGTGATTVTYGVISLKVGDVLKGSADQSITMRISPLALDCAPQFKAGDRLMLFLAKNLNGDYFSVSLQDAYWYIASDSRVYPAVVTDQLRQYSGITLKAFEADVKAARR